MNNSPIAVFDSGLGGLSVWKELRMVLPHESLIYYGDGKNCPYGPKPHGQVAQYVYQAAKFLIEQKGAKMLVLACNAATAAAVEHLRRTYPAVPIVGMEPAVKPAALSSRSGIIGIVATKGTLEGNLFLETSAKYGGDVKILPAVGEGFVELVESGKENSVEAVEAVRRVIEPLIEQGADRIVLGCTHYPFLAAAMKTVIGNRDVLLVDPAPAVARRVVSLLELNGLSAQERHIADNRFYTAYNEEYLQNIITKSEEACDL